MVENAVCRATDLGLGVLLVAAKHGDVVKQKVAESARGWMGRWIHQSSARFVVEWEVKKDAPAWVWMPEKSMASGARFGMSLAARARACSAMPSMLMQTSRLVMEASVPSGPSKMNERANSR